MKKKYKKLKVILDNDRHLNNEDLPQPLGPEIRTCWPGNTCSRRRRHFHSEWKTWHHGWRASSHCEVRDMLGIIVLTTHSRLKASKPKKNSPGLRLVPFFVKLPHESPHKI